MKNRQRASEEEFRAQSEEWDTQIPQLKTRARLDESQTAGRYMKRPEDRREKGPGRTESGRPQRGLTVHMSRTAGRAANSQARSLAEAVILQSIEDLWNPVCKRESLVFFEGDGFELCSEVAGLSYIKQLVMLRMLAHACPKTSIRNMEKSPLRLNVKDVQKQQNGSTTRSVL